MWMRWACRQETLMLRCRVEDKAINFGQGIDGHGSYIYPVEHHQHHAIRCSMSIPATGVVVYLIMHVLYSIRILRRRFHNADVGTEKTIRRTQLAPLPKYCKPQHKPLASCLFVSSCTPLLVRLFKRRLRQPSLFGTLKGSLNFPPAIILSRVQQRCASLGCLIGTERLSCVATFIGSSFGNKTQPTSSRQLV